MKDYPIGAIFTDAQGVRLEVVGQKGCNGCAYVDDEYCKVPDDECECEAYHRNDNTGVIFHPIEPQPVCHFTQRNKPQ